MRPRAVVPGPGKLGKASARTARAGPGERVNAAVTDLSQKMQLGKRRRQTYQRGDQAAAEERERWIELAQTAQKAGDNTTAVTGLQALLEAQPGLVERAPDPAS